MVSPTLAHLYLNENGIDSSGIAHLSKSKWPKLESIFLYRNNIGEQGIDYLLKSNWQKATDLHLSWNNIELDKKVWLVLGCWTKPKVIALLEGSETKFSGQIQSFLLKQRYPRVDLSCLTVATLYETV